MNIIILMKVFAAITIALIFLFTAYKTMKSEKRSAVKSFFYVILEVLLFIGLTFGSFWMINQSFIKVKLTKFNNRPMPSSEKLAIGGCVRNFGTYKANSVTLHIKVINNASGGSFSKSGDGRESTVKFSTVVARNLAPKTQKCFKKRFPYPPYFRLANIRSHLSVN